VATHYVPDTTGGGYAEQAARDRAAGMDPFAGEGDDFDPARARALLAEAGYEVAAHGKGLRARGFPPLEILYNVSEEHRQVAVAIQDMWRRHLGVSVTLRAEEWKVMLRSIQGGDFQIARKGWVADYDHPHSWLSAFLSSAPQNPTGWVDPALDALVEEAAAQPDPAEGIRLYRRAERRALDGMPRIPLYFRTKATLVKPWVKGFHPTPRDVHAIRWLWIDPAWQERAGDELAATPLELPPPAILGEEAAR
jgi:oligopeptide transport system substrate-binding protein